MDCGDFIQTKQSYKLFAAINRKLDAAKQVEDLVKKQTECVGLLMECVDEAKKEPVVAALGASLRALHLYTRFLAISIRDWVCCAGDVREGLRELEFEMLPVIDKATQGNWLAFVADMRRMDRE